MKMPAAATMKNKTRPVSEGPTLKTVCQWLLMTPGNPNTNVPGQKTAMLHAARIKYFEFFRPTLKKVITYLNRSDLPGHSIIAVGRCLGYSDHHKPKAATEGNLPITPNQN
jgi:hypothetical protein